MLKLTRFDQEGIQYVVAKAVMGLYRGSGFTAVDCSHRQYLVNETPEQIMAMPEMQYEMYPAFKFNTDGSVTKL